MDKPPFAGHHNRVTDADPPPRYELSFLTDQWAWESPLAADGFDQAKAAARQALIDLVKKEAPELACVTLLEAGAKLGVWDWVERQPWWTPL